MRQICSIAAKWIHASSLLRIVISIICLCLFVSNEARSTTACSIEFASFKIGPGQPMQIEDAIEFLVQFDSHLATLSESVTSDFAKANLTTQLREQLKTNFVNQTTKLKADYDQLTNNALEWSVEEARREFPNRAEALRRSAESIFTQTRTALRREQGASFNELADNPDLISPRLSYEVPQPSSSTGVQSANKLSVKFNAAVIDELRKDPHSASRFMRSMIKGYVGAHGGDGILRITDQHEALVEVKFVSKGNSRLIGCRRAGGLIEILRFYEKHNEGTGGSLKRFAKLCDE